MARSSKCPLQPSQRSIQSSLGVTSFNSTDLSSRSINQAKPHTTDQVECKVQLICMAIPNLAAACLKMCCCDNAGKVESEQVHRQAVLQAHADLFGQDQPDETAPAGKGASESGGHRGSSFVISTSELYRRETSLQLRAATS